MHLHKTVLLWDEFRKLKAHGSSWLPWASFMSIRRQLRGALGTSFILGYRWL